MGHNKTLLHQVVLTRFFKYAGIVVAVVAGLVVLLVIAANLIPGGQYKSLVSTIVKSSTGRELAIEGDFDIRLFSSLAFKAAHVKFANAPWGSSPQMLSIGRIKGKVALFPLLKGVLDMALTVENPSLLLETNRSGQANWQFSASEEGAQMATGGIEGAPEEGAVPENAGGLPLRLRIRKLQLDGGRIVYRDGKTGGQLVLHGKRLRVGPRGGKLTVAFAGRFDDTPLALSGAFDDAEFMVANRPTHVGLTGRFGHIRCQVEGTAGPLTPTYDLDVTLAVTADSVAAFAPLIGYSLPDLGPLSVTAGLSGRKGRYAVSAFKAGLDDRILTVRSTGAVGDLAALDGLDLTVKAGTGKLARLLKQIGYAPTCELPEALHATVILEGNGKRLAVKKFRAELQGKGMDAIVNGAAENLMALQNVRAQVSLQADSLGLLSRVVRVPLPPLAPLKAHARFVSRSANLKDLQVTADLENQNAHVAAAGSIRDPLKFRGVRGDVRLAMPSFAWLAGYFQMKPPFPGPLKASASIASRGKTLEASNIKVDLAGEKIQAEMAGSINDLLEFTGVAADIRLSADSLASLGPFVKRKLPASGPVSLEGRISAERGFTDSMDISVEVQSDGVTANLSGKIAAPPATRGMDVTFAVRAESLQKVGRLTGTQLQSREPLKLAGKFTRTEKAYELSDLNLKIGALDVTGRAAFKPPSVAGGRPQVSGELHAGRLDLEKWQRKTRAVSQKKRSPASQEKEPGVRKDRIFSTAALPFESLYTVDVELEVTLSNLATHLLQLSDVAARVTLDNGLLKVKPLKARVGKGVFNGSLMIDGRSQPAALAVDMRMTDATVRNFGGRLNSFAELNGRGDSVAAIMAGLNGQFEVDVRDVTLKTSFMTGFGSGLFRSLNPFAQDQDETKLVCGALLFDVKDGIANANRRLALQMTDVTWLGGGKINLKTEEIDFGMSPVPRKGTGINLRGFAKLAHIGGTLGKPRIELDPKDIVTKYGKYAAAMATGGISLAAEMLWDRIHANTDVCARVLKGLKPKGKNP